MLYNDTHLYVEASASPPRGDIIRDLHWLGKTKNSWSVWEGYYMSKGEVLFENVNVFVNVKKCVL